MIAVAPMQQRVIHNNRGNLDRAIWYSGHLMTMLATAEETGGTFSVIESVGRKGLSQYPPLHVHTRETETFYVLDGMLRFQVGEESIEAGPGSIVSLPPYLPHTYSQVSEDCRVLILLTPGGFEGYMREMSVPAESMTLPPPTDAPVDIEHIVSVAAKYGIQFPPPSDD